MLKILKFSKKYWLSMISIVLLLFIQANCDLALPGYTSNIVDVGIQNGGIEHAVPDAITESTMNQMLMFLTPDEQQLFLASYEKLERTALTDLTDKEIRDLQKKYPAFAGENIYLLNTEETDSLVDMLTQVEAVLLMLSAEGESAEMVRSSIINAMGIPVSGDLDFMQIFSKLPSETLVQIREQMMEQMGDVSSLMLDSMAVSFVKNEYEKIGINLEKMQMDYLRTLGIQMLALALLGMGVAIIVGYLASQLAAKTSKDLRSQVFQKVVGFSNAEMNQFSTASLITRCTNDIQQVQQVTVMLFRIVAYAPIMGIGGIIKVLQTNTSMTWIIGVAVAAILTLVTILMLLAMPKFKMMQKLIDRLNLVTREILTGIPVIRAFSREKHEEQRFHEASTDLMKTQLFTSRTMAIMMPVMMLIMNAITVLIIWAGAHGIDIGNLQVGDMMAFITYTMQIVMSFLMLTMISVMLPRAAVAAGRIEEVLQSETLLQNPKQPKQAAHAAGEIEFSNVFFRYPNAEEDALEDISFVAKPGETTAIIGSTGCGKSTLVQLIPRLFDVTGGFVKIDGIDIRDMDMVKLRKQIGYVPQKGVLFSGTIASNLRFGAKNATQEEIEQAAGIAQAAEFIESKPETYETAISQGGSNVSGGQKQRLSIARAIAKKPQIYIFDDSFSALDYKTDKALRKALKEQISGATVLIVAQRISTILYAEKIIVLDDGRIAGMGTHEELLANNEVYQQIAMSQLSQNDLKKMGG